MHICTWKTQNAAITHENLGKFSVVQGIYRQGLGTFAQDDCGSIDVW